MLDEEIQKNLIARLKRVEGQVRGIRRMVAEPRLCIEILQQLAAAEAALSRVSQNILRFHVSRCVPDAVGRGETEHLRQLNELVNIFERFQR